MKLKYLVHNDTSKSTYLIVRNIVQQHIASEESMVKAFGATSNQLEEICRGIQYDLNNYPRINTGSLYHWFKVEVLKNSVMVYHTPNLRTKTLLCEVVKEGGQDGIC